MKIKLSSLACARSGDKGAHTNVGVVFNNKDVYNWAVENLTEDKVKFHFSSIVKGKVKRYKLDNLFALNFILENSLDGGGSESLLIDAQGKTYGQAMLLMEVDIPEKLKIFINE